jgi:cation transport ATPase
MYTSILANHFTACSDKAGMNNLKSLNFRVSGLSCASCVGRVEAALKKVPGVETARVNLACESVQIVGAGISASELVRVLVQAGYPAELETVELEIEGMTCASCVGRVQKSLLSASGVVSASVNLATETAQIIVLAGSDGALAAIKAAGNAGYTVHRQRSLQSLENRKTEMANTLLLKTIFAGILTLPLFILEMGSHLIPAMHHWVWANIGMQNSYLIQFVLTTILLLGPGFGFFTKGIPALFNGSPDMNSLVALGTGAAFGFSTVSTFAPQWLPKVLRRYILNPLQ